MSIFNRDFDGCLQFVLSKLLKRIYKVCISLHLMEMFNLDYKVELCYERIF